MRVRKKQKWRWVRRETRPDPALLVQLCGFQGNSLLRHTAPSRLLQQDCHVGLPWNCPWQGRLGERCLPVSFPLHCASTGGCAQHRERASPAHRDYTSNPQPFLRKPHSASHSRVYYPVQKQPTPTGGERMPTSQSRDEREKGQGILRRKQDLCLTWSYFKVPYMFESVPEPTLRLRQQIYLSLEQHQTVLNTTALQ